MMLPRMHVSPMPMTTSSGFVSLTATAPTLALLSWPSVTGAQLSPASVVFHRPPPVAPKYASFGRPFTPEAAMDRPPRSGPMLRHLNEARNAESGAAGASVLTRDGVWGPATPTTTAAGRDRPSR
jgi:hypothetical protein